MALFAVFLAGSTVLPVMASDAAILTCPRKIYRGSVATATVTTLDSVSRQPVDRPVRLWLVSNDRTWRLMVGEGRTGVAGLFSVEFNVPFDRTGDHYVSAEVEGLGETLEVQTAVSEGHAILIETDKPVYKPGQEIKGRLVLLNNRLQPVSGTVEVTFHDAKGLRLARAHVDANEYGVAPFSLQLASEVNYGVWKIRARSLTAEVEKDVRVEDYVLPRFEVKLNLERNWVLVDEEIRGSVDARYFFGKPVEGVVRLTAKRWVGIWEEYASATGALEGGRLLFRLPAVGFVAGTPANGGQGSITLEASVEDATGHRQALKDVLKVTQAPVVLTIVPLQDSIRPGFSFPVLVRAESPEGQPEDVTVGIRTSYRTAEGTVIDSKASLLETVNGSATLSLIAPAKTSVAEIQAETTVAGHKTVTETVVGAAYSPSGRFLALTRLSGVGPVAVGEVVEFSVAGPGSSSVYYEVYAGGRTILSGATNRSSFPVVVTPDMVPKFRVVAYSITDSNEVTADSITVGVSLAQSITVRAEFDKAALKPGDPVRLRINAGPGRRTLLGVSLVDESVLALGRSRLHMAEVFSALEQEFMTPQVEVHDPAPGPVFFPTVNVKGALDVLHEAGLAVDTSAAISVPAGRTVGMGWKNLDVWSPPSAPAESAASVESPRLRQFFPETWIWEPMLFTDESGEAVLDLEAPDSITSWKLSVVGTCLNGASGSGLGLGEGGVTVFQDFFVEPSLPYSVQRNEDFKVKVDVFNYRDEKQEVRLRFEESGGLELLGAEEVSVEVPANSAAAAFFAVRPTKLGDIPFTLTAMAQGGADAVLRQIKVVPEGIPASEIFNGVIEGGEMFPLDVSVPEEATADSHRAFLYLTPSPVGQSMEGVSDLLGIPYGCGEQNMIFLAPDVEILRYLNEIGELAPGIRAKAEYYINVGYQRELTFRSDDGGFAAFGGETGSLWLTAFVLSVFSAAREVRDIDETVLADAAKMLQGRQLADGSFKTDDFLVHREMAGGLGNVFSMAAFVVNALADYSNSEFDAVLAHAASYLQANYPGVAEDPYSLAIAASALLKVPGFSPVAEQLIDRLLELAGRDGAGIHWEPYPVETTAYAAIALMNSRGGAGRPEAVAAIDWLSTQRNALGGYGHSTQDTVTALRALFLAARKVHRDIDIRLTVLDSGYPIFSVEVNRNNFDLLQQFELPLGHRRLTLHATGAGKVAFQVVNHYTLPNALAPKGGELELDVFYSAEHVEADQLVDVNVRVVYTGGKEKTGMVILDVSVPTGFEVVASSLEEVVQSGHAQRAEVAGRKVIFYIEGLVRLEPLLLGFQVRALYPVRAQTYVSRAYEYYDRSVSGFHVTKTKRSARFRPGGRP